MTAPIPANIDVLAILQDLKDWGWRDHKIEIACGLSVGYVDHLRRGDIIQISYQRAARLYNFWLSEKELRDAEA